MVTVGDGLPLLWQLVQVEPLFPENPEIPPGYALAEDAKHTTANITIAAMPN